jgi:hypothetical protein
MMSSWVSLSISANYLSLQDTFLPGYLPGTTPPARLQDLL